MRRSIVGLVLVSLSLLAACSSGDPAPAEQGTPAEAPSEATAPADYVEGLCAAVVSYQTDLEAENEALQESISGEPDAAELKSALESFLAALSDRSQRLVDEVDGLGTPAVDDGEGVRSALTSAIEQVVSLFDEARSDIAALATDDLQALTEGFAEAGAKLQEAAVGISGSLDGLSSPELKQAAADAPSCEGVA
ncbi:MAG TPA: hypothetical protein VNC60_01445 [Actinomycetota bacterium]|nr:hypothetical protein [Actinomycetota bacterium]